MAGVSCTAKSSAGSVRNEIETLARKTSVAELSQVNKSDGHVPWMTDSGNFIYDVAAGIIEDPAELEARLRHIPGVVESGLFVGRATVAARVPPGRR